MNQVVLMISRSLLSALPLLYYLSTRVTIKEEDGEGIWTYLLDLHRLLYISHLIAQRLYSTYYPSALLHTDRDLIVHA